MSLTGGLFRFRIGTISYAGKSPDYLPAAAGPKVFPRSLFANGEDRK